MTVIVVGAGIGGLTLALALARRGLPSVVVERASAIETVGAGIQLSPNATRLLADLGVEAQVRAAGVAPDCAEVRDAGSGRLLLSNRLGEAAQTRWRASYRTLTRAALQTILLEAVNATGLADVRLGHAVWAVRQQAGRVEAVLESGEVVQGDSLIGCDGLHSVVRTAVVGEAPARFTGQTAWRGLARMPVAGAARVQVWTGPRRHFVRYPVGEGLVNIVAVAEATGDDVESWDQTGEAARLARAFADWPEPVRATIAAVDQPWRSALYDRPPLTRWTAGRISLLGDAAHPMLPFLAQGAAMAIEDAWVAADLLARHEPDVALKAYERARLDRTAKAQAWASRNAALFHLPSPVAAGVFGAAGWLDKARGVAPEARFDWLYGWRPAAI
jgi:salicylate hydroxylase